MSTIVDQLADQMFQKPTGPASTQPAIAAPPQRTIVDDILDQDRQFVHKWQTDYSRIYERARKINPTYGFNPRPDILGPMDVEDPYTYAEAARQMETDPAEVEKARAQLLQEAIKQRGQEVIDDLRQFMPALEGESEYDYNQRLQRIYSQRLYDEGIRPLLLNQPAKMERGLVGGVMAGMARGWTGLAEDVLGGGTGLIASARAGIYGDDDAGVQALRRAEENFHDYYGRRGREAHVLRPSDSVAEGGGFQPLNWRWWSESLGEQSPNFVTLMAGGGASAQILKQAGYGARAIKAISMMQTFGTAAALESGSAYNQVRADLIQKGFKPEDASTVAALEGVSIGIVNGLIELLPFDEFILKDKKTMGKLVRAARGFAVEGSTESVQELWNVVVGAIGHDDPITREKFMQVLGAGAIGGIMGAGTDVVSPHGVGEGEQQKRPLMVFDEKSGYFWKLDPKTGGYTPFDPKSGRYYDFSKAGTMQPVTPTTPTAPPAWTPPDKGFLTIGDIAGTNRYEGSGAPAPTFGEQGALPGMEQEAKLTEWYDTTARLLVQYQIQPGATEQDMARQLQANKDLLHSLRLDILKDMQAGVQPDGTLATLTDRYLPDLGVPEGIGVRLIQGIYDETAATQAKTPPAAALPVFGEQTAIPGLEAEAKLTGWYDRTAQRLARYHMDASTTPEQIDRHVQGYSWLLGESRNLMRQAIEQGMNREQATDAAFNALREVWPEQSWELFNQTIGEVYDQVAQQVKPAAPTPPAAPPDTAKPAQTTKPKATRTVVTPPTQETTKTTALNEEEENLAGFVEAMGNDLERGALLDELRSSFGHLKVSDQTLNQIADQPGRVRDILAQAKSAPVPNAPATTRRAPRIPQPGPATTEQPTAPAAPPAPKTPAPPRETGKATTAQPDKGRVSAPPQTPPTTEKPAGGRGIDLGISDADFNDIAADIGAELDKLEGGAGDEAQAMPEKARITGKLWQLAKKAGLYHLGKTQDFKGWAKALNETLRGHLSNDQLVTIWNGMRFLPVVRQQVGSLPQVSADTLTNEGASDGGTDSSQSEQAGTRGSGTLEEAPAEDGPEAPGGGAADRGGERGVPGGTGRRVGDDAGDGDEHTRSADGTRAGVPVPPAGETGDVDVAQGVGDAQSGSLTDFHFEADESVGDKLIGEGGIETKFRDNLAALTLVHQLEQQNRLATEDEKKVLARYTGWGWGKQIFDRYGKHQERYQQLRQLIEDGVITEEEWYAARQSSLNAHYTSPPVIAGMWQAVEAMGFKGGNVIEAGFGIGHFKGMMPRPLKAVSYYHGIERDKLTWRIARQLYQRGSVVNEDFVESRRIPGFYRLAIGNVPFGEETIREKDAKTGLDVYPVKPNLHDFFILKMLDQLEPGGVAAVITSNGTMDKQNTSVRQLMADRAAFLGAIRLPQEAFLSNAGTKVVTDILFFQKRAPGNAGATTEGPRWLDVAEHRDDAGNGMEVNQYFVDHPDQVIGTMKLGKSMYGPRAAMVVEGKALVPNIQQEIAKRLDPIVSHLVAEVGQKPQQDMSQQDIDRIAPAGDDLLDDNWVVRGGKLYRVENGQLAEYLHRTTRNPDGKPRKPDEIKRIAGMVEVRTALREVFRTQRTNAADAEIDGAIKKLNQVYDRFVEKHGPLNDPLNIRLFYGDPDAYRLQALEDYDSDSRTAKKMPVFSERVIQTNPFPTKVETAQEALIAALNRVGRIDLDYMAELSGKGQDELLAELGDRVFLNPDGHVWETADAYLSGNVKRKLEAARQAFEQTGDGRWRRNIEALEAVQPPDLKPSEIAVGIGAPWVSGEVYEQFFNHITNARVRVTWNDAAGGWSVDHNYHRSHIDQDAALTYDWGTSRMSAIALYEHALMGKQPKVFDYYEEDGKRKAVVNQEQTALAEEKFKKIKDAFKDWVWSEKNPRAAEMVRLYNDRFNTNVVRKYDGSHLTLPGVNASIALRPHQKNAIWRIITSGNTLLHHEVGAGKTYVLAGAAMELRRLGLAKKPMFAVPNHLIGQWAQEFQRLYPTAKVLAVTAEDFTPDRRRLLFSRIATGNWDAVIVAHSQLIRIPVTAERERAFIRRQLEMLEEQITDAKAGDPDNKIVRTLEKAREKLSRKLQDLLSVRRDPGMTFEDMGVDALFVDESHAFKNLWIMSRRTRVAGMQNAEADRAMDMYLKSRYINEITNHRGVVFATGTPVTNTMGELFTVQRYLQEPTLEMHGVHKFDYWADTFGDMVTGIEAKPTGAGYRINTRFARFRNVPELLAMYRQVADIITKEMIGLPIPRVKGGEHIVVETALTEWMRDFVKRADERMKAVREKRVDPTVDNPLKIYGELRQATLDHRLIDPKAPVPPDAKITQAADRIAEIHKRWAGDQGAQLVFMDMGTPKDRGKAAPVEQEAGEDAAGDIDDIRVSDFQLYAELKRLLIERGVPTNEIAFIHDAKDDADRRTLFRDVRMGKVRVLIGSTAKMGAGMNVQARLVALHHMNVPWTPEGLEQREGRILRQGNKLWEKYRDKFEVELYVYLMSGAKGGMNSNDAQAWQLIKTKAGFIRQLLNDQMNVREMEDIASTEATASQLLALALGDPAMIRKVEVEQELTKLRRLQKAHEDQLFDLRREAEHLPRTIARMEEEITKREADIKARDEAKAKLPEDAPFEMTVKSTSFQDRGAAGSALLAAIREIPPKVRTEIGEVMGFRLFAESYTSKINPENVGHHTIRLSIQGQHEYVVPSWSGHPEGSVASITNEIKGWTKDLEDTRKEHERAKRRLSDVQVRLQDAGFAQAKRLTDLETELGQLDAKLEADAKGQARPIMDDEGAAAGDEEQQALPFEEREKKQRPPAVDRSEANVTDENFEQHTKLLDMIPDDQRVDDADQPDVQAMWRAAGDEPTASETDLAAKYPDKKPKPEKPANLDQITKKIMYGFGVPIAHRKFRKRAWGLYYPKRRIIRSKIHNDIYTYTHETGHYLDDILDLQALVPARSPVELELLNLGKATSLKSYTKQQVRKEGVAEFVRMLIIDPEEAQRRAPGYHALFLSKLANHPDLLGTITELQGVVRAYVNAEPEQRIDAMIEHPDTEGLAAGPRRSPAKRINALDYLVQEVFDENWYLRRVDKALGGGALPPNMSDSAYFLQQGLSGVMSKVQAWIEDGIRDEAGRPVRGGWALRDVLRKASPGMSRNVLRKFENYLVARRVLELYGQAAEGKRELRPGADRPLTPEGLKGQDRAEMGVTYQDAKKWVPKVEAEHPSFKDAARMWYEMNDAVLEYLRRRGQLSDTQIEVIRRLNQNYASLSRVMGEDEQLGYGNTSGARGYLAKLFRVMGSGRRIRNPIVSYMANTRKMVQLAERNWVVRKFADRMQKAEGSGLYGQVVTVPVKGTSISIDEIKDDLAAALRIQLPPGMAIEDLIDPEAFVQVFRPTRYARREMTIPFFDGGKLKMLEVHDPTLYQLLTRADEPTITAIEKWFLAPVAHMFRVGVVKSLSFLVGRDTWRNMWQGTVQSRTGLGPWHYFLGIYNQLAGAEHVKQYFAAGGGHSNLLQGGPRKLRQAYMKATHSTPMRVMDRFIHPFDTMEALFELSDNAMKVEEFKRLKRQIAKRQPELSAEEIITRSVRISRGVVQDFSIMGRTSRRINRVSAFFAAQLGGWRRLGQNIVEFDKYGGAGPLAGTPFGFMLRGFTWLTLPALALWWLLKDNPDWDEREDERKAYLLIPRKTFDKKNREWWRLALPFEVGYLFAHAPVQMAHEAYKKGTLDVEAFKKVFPTEKAALDIFWNAVPTAILPLLEAYFNYDTFHQRPLVPYWDQDKEPYLQYNRWTSPVAKELGRMLNIRPVVIDHIIEGYTGTMGREAVDIGGRLLLGGNQPPGHPSGAGIPGLSGMVSWDLASQAASVRDFYERRNELRRVETTLNSLSGREKAEYRRQHADILRQKPRIQIIERIIERNRDGLDRLWQAPPDQMTAGQKRETANRHWTNIINATRKVRGLEPLPPMDSEELP